MKKHLTFSLALLTIVCGTVTAQLPSYLPADGLMGWWPFNGNANDESGNGNDGVVNGAQISSDRFGNSNSSYLFTASSSEQNIETTLIGPTGNSGRTISFWFEPIPSGNSSIKVLCAYGGIGGVGTTFVPVIKQNNQIGLDINGNQVFYSSNLINGWNHFIAVYTPEFGTNILSVKIYVNGNLLQNVISISSQLVSINTGVGIPFILGDFGIDQMFNGKMDDIAIYNRALTPQEIQNLYTGTNETVDTGNGAAPLPQGIPYQAAARDAQGQVIADAPVNVRFSLHEGAVDGAVSYSETHALTTNSIGLFNTVFGNGTPEQSAFDSINWAATTKFLQVEIDLGDGYVDMGTTQLLSVPYAFRSDEAARIKNAGLPIFADNAAALAGGLVAGEMYRTASGDLKVAY